MLRRPPAAFWIAVALLAAVCLVYAPALRAGFIWDDDAHVTPAALRSWSGLARIWTELGATQQYYPILHSAFWLEHWLWGGAPAGYHLTNVALHFIAALLLLAILRRLKVRGALLAAAVFALHPVHVESVAWISEQKNTLSAVFYLGAALAYLRFDATRARPAYGAASVLFILALLTKTVTATLPAALLVVVWWQRGALHARRDFMPLAPWFATGVVAGLVTAWVERTLIGAEGVAFDLTLLQRCLLAPRVAWFYVGKLIWPANLTFIYPRWEIDPSDVIAWLPLAAMTALLVVLWRVRTRVRGPLVAVLLFGGTLFPVLGFFNVYPFQYSFVADHFQYLASIPLVAASAAVVAWLDARIRTAGATTNYLGRACVCFLLLALGVMARRQTLDYRDNETLFRATLTRNPECWMAYNNLGKELMADKAHAAEVLELLEHAIALHPEYPEARNNYGLALTQAGRPAAAIPHLEAAVRLKPSSYQMFNNLGIALASSGRPADSLRAFQQAASLNPKLPNIHENWAKALVLLGRQTEANERFAIAAQLRQSR